MNATAQLRQWAARLCLSGLQQETGCSRAFRCQTTLPSPTDVQPTNARAVAASSREVEPPSARTGRSDTYACSYASRRIATEQDIACRRLLTVARAAGVNLQDLDSGVLLNAMGSNGYPAISAHSNDGSLYPSGTLENLQLDMLRRSNMSMPCKKNQHVYGTVYVVTKQRVWVDVGHSSLAMFNRKVLDRCLLCLCCKCNMRQVIKVVTAASAYGPVSMPLRFAGAVSK
jgi:hypothetical protein